MILIKQEYLGRFVTYNKSCEVSLVLSFPLLGSFYASYIHIYVPLLSLISTQESNQLRLADDQIHMFELEIVDAHHCQTIQSMDQGSVEAFSALACS
jgi:hypothetical protein